MKQQLRYIIYSAFSILVVWGFTSCKDIDDNVGTEEYSLAGTPINVSAIAEELEVTVENNSMTSRAVEENFTSKRAEEVKWLIGALKNGIDITYSNMTESKDANGKVKEIRDKSNERVAILKWTGRVEGTGTNARGEYTFIYKNTEIPAKWNDNGLHYFEGQYVPAEIRNKNTDGTNNTFPATLTSDQHDDSDYSDGTDGTPSETIGNYTLLSHYIGMPPSWKKSATIDQVNLPFKHRLGRVLAYVLIDESLNTTLRGYTSAVRDSEGNFTQKDDPSTTYFHFNNVKVLDHVEVGSKTVGHDGTEVNVSTLTPIWKGGYSGEYNDPEQIKPARRVIPHFFDEVNKSATKTGAVVEGVSDADANSYFIVYENTKDAKKTYPRDSGWKTIHQNYRTKGGATGNDAMTDPQVTKADDESGYRRHAYTKVPIYDIIVRPTYNNTYDNVMYDEAGYYNSDGSTNDTKIHSLYNQNNSILFELELESGLQYSKTFTFDLNANQQTVVYLTIDREGISYDESSYETWNETSKADGYYGIDNGEDIITHNLSEAGSSWQRAIRNDDQDKNVTDGNKYDDDNVDASSTGRGQYMNSLEWTKEFAKAWATFDSENKMPTEHGDRHGYYFMLDKDIEIDMRLIPNDFIFTGHLDGKGHKITLANTHMTEKYVTANDNSVIKDLKDITYANGSTNIRNYNLPELYELFKIDNIEERGEGEWVIPNLNVIESVEERGEGEWVIPNLDAVNGNENRGDGSWDNNNLNDVGGNENRGDGWTRSASGKTRANEEKTYYIMVKVTDTDVLNALYDGTIDAINNTGTIQKYYYKKTPTSFSKFKLDPHSVYLEEPSTEGRNSYLFTGLNGMYVTKQEFLGGDSYVEHPTYVQLKSYSNNHGIWEANVHAEPNKANNNTTQYNWVPYNGYRGEILNVEISGGYFFPTDITKGKEQTDKVNGYILNCKNYNNGILQNIVDIPKYK